MEEKIFKLQNSPEDKVSVSVSGNVTEGVKSIQKISSNTVTATVTTCTCWDENGNSHSVSKNCDGWCDCSNPKSPKVHCN